MSQASAQSLSLSISPPILEVLIKPGKSITQGYKLVNNGEPAVVTVRIAEYKENGISQDKDFTPESWINTVSANFSFGQPFLLPAGAEKQIVLRINPPPGTKEQDFLRVLVFTTTPIPPADTSQSSASITLGSILLIRTSNTGMLTKGAMISKFVLPSIIDSFGPAIANIEVKNTGKTYIRPIGEISLTGPIGKGKFAITPKVIFAGQTKLITTDVSSANNQTLTLLGFFLGKYKLTVSFSLDEGNIKVEQTKTFYAIPWKLLLLFAGIVIIIKRLKSPKQKKKK